MARLFPAPSASTKHLNFAAPRRRTPTRTGFFDAASRRSSGLPSSSTSAGCPATSRHCGSDSTLSRRRWCGSGEWWPRSRKTSSPYLRWVREGILSDQKRVEWVGSTTETRLSLVVEASAKAACYIYANKRARQKRPGARGHFFEKHATYIRKSTNRVRLFVDRCGTEVFSSALYDTLRAYHKYPYCS